MEEVIQHKPLVKRRRYRQAAETFKAHPTLTYKDCEAKMFIKNERMNATKAPRAIQARSPRYCLKAQQYLGPVERHLFHTPYDRRFVSKGLDQRQKATHLRKLWDQFKDPVAILADHVTFDGKQHSGWLKAEHSYYQQYYPGDEELISITDKQLINYGRTAHGIRYRVKGTRLSGDANTSLGNCITNAALLHDWLDEQHVHHLLTVDGDDSVIFIEREDLGRLNFNALQSYGFETKVEIAQEFEHIEFCQCRPINGNDGWIMVRTPKRMIERSFMCIDNNYCASLELVKRWYHTVGVGELRLNAGIPVLQAASAALERAHTNSVAINEDHALYRTVKKVSTNEITNKTRASFHTAFGISPTKQKLIEQYFELMNWDVDIIDKERSEIKHNTNTWLIAT
jgi:hypothetical protein